MTVFRFAAATDQISGELRLLLRWTLVLYLPLLAVCLILDPLVGRAQGLALGQAIQLVAFSLCNVRLYWFFYLHPGKPTQAGTQQAGLAADPWGLSAVAVGQRLQTFGLSARELEVAVGLGRRDSYKSIADTLCISVDTVKSHARAIYRKTGCGKR